MSRLFYPKLAISNIHKNLKLFMPYILMNIGIITMFYIMHAISVNDGLNVIPGSDSLKAILTFGTYVIGIFSAVFIFYTNSFLIKRRKKEIGLYNILGMGKRHLGRMLFLETIFVAFICIGLGLFSGLVLSKLMYLILLKILTFSVSMKFTVSIASIYTTAAFFTIIFLVNLVFNLGHIHLSKPIELLKGSNVGEREPKTKWLMTLVGIIALTAGYVIAQMVKAPLEALSSFFIAVVLVMIGTYYLFTAGSIALLKLLKKNKSFYYHPMHFTSISGMIYRMKQNAIGLANICILSTAVLVTLSTTFSLYIGLDDVLKERYPQEVSIQSSDITDVNINAISEIIQLNAKSHDIEIKNESAFTYVYSAMKKTKSQFTAADRYSYASDYYFIHLLSIEDYNKYSADDIILEEDEAVIFSNSKPYGYPEIQLGDSNLKIKKEIDTFAGMTQKDIVLSNNYFVFVKDMELALNLYESYKPESEDEDEADSDVKYVISFDTVGESNNITAFNNSLYESINRNVSSTYMESRLLSKKEFFAMYGGFLFIGIFLGALFLMATVMIIYYKQVSEGYDDKTRFEIMQKVGMSQKEIKRTIQTQIVMVFFLPLVFAVIHIGFAFNVITKLLAIFNFINTPLFFLCTVGTILIFALIYMCVFFITARAYYKIVK